VTITVATWNVWWRFGPWEQRQPAIIETLRRHAPDVICLQEVWGAEGGDDQAALFGQALGYSFVSTPSPYWEGASFSNAVLSRWPILEVQHRRLSRADGKTSPRTALVVTIDAPQGPMVVVCTHLDYRFDASLDRQTQVREVAGIVSDVRGDPESAFPVILAGDFNAVPDSDEIRALTGRTPPLLPNLVFQDCWELVGSGPGHTWSDANAHLTDATWPNRRLDYVFVAWPRPKGLAKPVAARLIGVEPIDGVTPSDHYGVLVELRDA
jgi:endonuclease/exonuclease/phosphatase family metal-dependent hydrolase